MDTKTERFASELRTATEVQRVAREHGTSLTIEQAHEAWAEHSDDYCAQWLCWRDENPRIEILQALTKYRERHAKTLARSNAADEQRRGKDSNHE